MRQKIPDTNQAQFDSSAPYGVVDALPATNYLFLSNGNGRLVDTRWSHASNCVTAEAPGQLIQA
jgi:hypothetical protein